MTFALSVPANLLLLGEYAVTEEGGLGIALASSPRIRLRLRESGGGGLAIAGRMGPGSFEWIEGESEPPALLAACLDEARDRLGRLSPEGQPGRLSPATIDIDSSAFFSADGTKRGFGSSAAVAVGLSAALLRLGGLEGTALETALFPTALASHRRSQGGRGSGYDVAASRFGGLGLFTGGANPSWTGLPTRLLVLLEELDLSLRFGDRPVSSPSAVGAYRNWKEMNQEAHRAFLSASTSLVREFAAAANIERILALLGEAGATGAALGDAIGVPARPMPSLKLRPIPLPGAPGLVEKCLGALSPVEKCLGALSPVEKCLGAGDELILVAALRDSVVGEGGEEGVTLPLRVEREGLRWE